MIKFLDLKAVNDLHKADIEQAVQRVLDSGWYLLGNEVRAFEEEYARYVGTSHAIGCGNGLEALTLIFRAYMELGILSPGDEVIVPANTYIASILAVTECGLTPVPVEPDPHTLQISAANTERAITPRTRAVMAVHLYGRCAYTEELEAITVKHGLLLIEDNAQAHGCKFGTRKTGSLGHAAGHSFYPGKNLGALGDAGAVTTDNPTLSEAIRAIANYGSQRKYVFKYKGINSRLDEMQAAVLRAKLQHLDADNARRREIADIYLKEIINPRVSLPPIAPIGENVWHIFPVFTDKRQELQRHLSDKGIQTLIHYPVPPHKQECYKEWNGRSYPATEKIHETELSLPISPAMTYEEAHEVAVAINSWKM